MKQNPGREDNSEFEKHHWRVMAIKVGELRRIVSTHRKWERNSSLHFTHCLQLHPSVTLEIKERDPVSLEGML